MNTTESSRANQWNHHHGFVARTLSDHGDSTGDWTNGMSAHLPSVPDWNGQGRMQDRATRLLMEEMSRTARRVRE